MIVNAALLDKSNKDGGWSEAFIDITVITFRHIIFDEGRINEGYTS